LLWLLLILALVLLLPFTLKPVESNLEVFLFLMGIWAASMSQVLDYELVMKSLKDPIYISLAVFVAGLLFRWIQHPFEKAIQSAVSKIPERLFFSLIIVILGIVSSIITAIIAAIVLVSIIEAMGLDHKSKVKLVILSCFSIGLGSSLTPIGEPLSTIVTTKLNEEFFYLFNLVGFTVIPAVLIFGILGAILIRPIKGIRFSNAKQSIESYYQILLRSLKVFLFVMALTLLGAGFEPIISAYLLDLNSYTLYWINMISAVLDNATLASAEISTSMDNEKIKSIVLGLLISGGMLIPGNIPNIIAANKLNISSKEWARFGVPIGLVAMTTYFVIMLVN
jgi:predicted cation transporter